MKKILTSFFCLALLFVAGCSTTTLVETQYRDGQYSKKVYSKYYDDGGYLFGEDIGMLVCVDHVKKNIPILYGIQRWLGALGPSDMDAEGLVTLYFWNLSGKDYSLEIKSISNGRAKYNNAPENTLTDFNGNLHIPASDKTKHSIVAGKLPINNFGKEVDLSIVINSSGKTITKQYTAERRTFDYFNQFFGPDGKVPYPWLKK
jgi:hypothetical protein